MKRFAALFAEIDQTTKTTAKVAALAAYFDAAPEQDRVWTVALFSGRRPKRAVSTTRLREWAAEQAGLPLWLVEDSYAVVGDLAETIALILPPPDQQSDKSLSAWMSELSALSNVPEPDRKTWIVQAWRQLPANERLVFHKLLTGGFRVGISQKLMTRALAQSTGRDEADMAHRLMGDWSPLTTDWRTLMEADDATANAARPYPFFLAHPLQTDPQLLGPPKDWLAEWKWDGIRGQLIRREGQLFVWSRGEELITDRFPEFARTIDFLPDGVVLDGEILAWAQDRPLPFQALQKRIGRKSPSKSVLKSAPVILLAYDLLEWDGRDMRAKPLTDRRKRLERLVADLPAEAPIRLFAEAPLTDWGALAARRAEARAASAEGLMLKRRNSVYGTGRKKGDWWKWKLDPMTVDAVMIYAQAGHGRRANLFTDFTFAVWSGNDLVPVTKAYSGLTDDEFRAITAWVRKNTLQRFGPVRQVPPEHVFEIAFEGVQESPRHKSGIALRFPRMARWRKDKPVSEANTLADLRQMLDLYP